MTTPDDIGIKPVAWHLVNSSGHTVCWYSERETALSEQKHYWPALELSALYSDPDVRAALDAKDAQIAKLTALLKPFVDEATESNGNYRADWLYAADNDIAGYQFADLTFGDFRRAFVTLKEHSNGN